MIKKKLIVALMSVFLLVSTGAFAQGIENTIVAVTPSGKKYHKINCETLSRSKEVWKITIKEAKENGYIECYACKPFETARRENLQKNKQ